MNLKHIYIYIYGKSHISEINLYSNIYQHTETEFTPCKKNNEKVVLNALGSDMV